MSAHQHDGHSHDHHHHDHHHDHPPAEQYSARPHPEYVVLEIGDDIGALIVHANLQLHGVEIEISPTGDDARRQHKEVLERRAGNTAAFTAVFDGLPAGSYTLWIDGEALAREVDVEAGAVAQLDWRHAELRAAARAGR
jgi:hypothetical protein